MIPDSSDDIWNNIVSELLIRGKMTVPKILNGTEVPRPETSGLFRKSVGEIKGQIADWRATVGGSNRGIHIVEYKDHYEMHVDQYDPRKNPIKHLLIDSPKYGFALGALTIGIGAVLALIRKK
jgi:hypothetical protein